MKSFCSYISRNSQIRLSSYSYTMVLLLIVLFLVVSYASVNGGGNLFAQENSVESEPPLADESIASAEETAEPIQTGEQTNEQKGETGPDGGSLPLVESDEGLTPLERYARTTDVHPLRRADVLFFISIPFTLLWSNFLIDRFKDISVIAAYFEGVRGALNLRNTNYIYDHNSFAKERLDPFYIFKWLNAVIWPLVILTNDFIERASDPEEWEQAKEEMYDNRFHLNLIYHPFR